MMNEEDFFYEIYRHLPQGGPGSDKSTRRALKLLPNLPEGPIIIDFGCGPGRSSVVLAAANRGQVIAIDNYRPFLEALSKRVRRQNLSYHVTALIADMAVPPLAKETAELIWSEGAIYFLGFEQGLKSWRKFLKINGYIAVSELTWLTACPAKEATVFWQTEYPAMQSVGANIDAVKRAGYELINWFVLPQQDWANFYRPLQRSITALRAAYPTHPLGQQVAAKEQAEIDLWTTHGDDYGYVFYLARKL
jgi:SAM-dependent methyltransferase